jgi:hypothetical protein
MPINHIGHIAPADQETVFEEFRQVGTAAKKVEGTGLGLLEITTAHRDHRLHPGIDPQGQRLPSQD